MLDAIKGFAGGTKTQKQLDELQVLITAAREERSALSAMLTQLSMRSSKLSQVGKSLDQVDQKATSTTTKLDDLGKRLEGFEGRARSFAEIDRRVQALLDTATQAQQAAEKLMAPDGDLQ